MDSLHVIHHSTWEMNFSQHTHTHSLECHFLEVRMLASPQVSTCTWYSTANTHRPWDPSCSEAAPHTVRHITAMITQLQAL